MEYCRGGELHHSVGMRSYTEESVAYYMRSVLHTLAQCHAHRILHRDIKPGNFMLLSKDEGAPLKAIDFGLAVFFDPKELPRTDLGLDGTPWFMAPEVLNSQTFPASDLWSAGVMAYQLLSGYLPFDDVRNPNAPALSIIWRSILTEEPSFRRSAWNNVSEEAKNFVKMLLQKDHERRPTAKEALQHPWLQKEFHVAKSRPLSATVVQRIQRYAQKDLFKRTILELLAGELLKMAPPRLDSSVHGGRAAGATVSVDSRQLSESNIFAKNSRNKEDSTTQETSYSSEDRDSVVTPTGSMGDDSSHHGGLFPMSPERTPTFSDRRRGVEMDEERKKFSNQGRRSIDSLHSHDLSGTSGAYARSPSVRQIVNIARPGYRRGAHTVHGPGDYWKIMRQASEIAAMASGHGQMNYLRTVPRTEEEREEAHKAARLSLDTSAHGGTKYHEILSQLRDYEGSLRKGRLATSKSSGAILSTSSMDKDDEMAWKPSEPDLLEGKEMGRVGKEEQSEASLTASIIDPFGTQSKDNKVSEVSEPLNHDSMEQGGRGRSAAFHALQRASLGEGLDAHSPQTGDDLKALQSTIVESEQVSDLGRGPMTVKRSNSNQLSSEAYGKDASPTQAPGNTTGPVTHPEELEGLMRRLKFRQGRGLTVEALGDGLRQLGYDLAPSEIEVLLSQLDIDEDQTVNPEGFVASQLDWAALRKNNRDLWLECAKRAFADLDTNSDGKLTASELLSNLKAKLPAAEVDYALEDALLDAGQAEADEIDFEGFLKMIKVGSVDSIDALDQYDPRLASHAGGDTSGLAGRLQTVPENGPNEGPP